MPPDVDEVFGGHSLCHLLASSLGHCACGCGLDPLIAFNYFYSVVRFILKWKTWEREMASTRLT